MLLRGLGPSPVKVTLRNAVDRLVADGVRTPEDLIERVNSTPAPPVELHETEGKLVVRAHLPGVAPEELHIDVSENTLIISGETREDAQRAEGDQVLHEHFYGAFERTVTLPCAVKADQAVAEFDNGILTLVLPKAEVIEAERTEDKHQAATGS
jgi:HSP20 family protein